MMNIVVSTGAGISAESGIHTYRDKNGLWTKYDPQVVSHRRGWLNRPLELLQFQNEIRQQFAVGNYKPNAAHYALTRLQQEWKHGEVTIVTQNVDGLHADAGSNVMEIHGSKRKKFCEGCALISPYDRDIVHDEPCVQCGKPCQTRPAVCFFGEMPFGMPLLETKLDNCHIFAVIGSSLEVMPGNIFVDLAKDANAETYYLNMEEPKETNLRQYDHKIYGPATETVPAWVDMLLK